MCLHLYQNTYVDSGHQQHNKNWWQHREEEPVKTDLEIIENNLLCKKWKEQYAIGQYNINTMTVINSYNSNTVIRLGGPMS